MFMTEIMFNQRSQLKRTSILNWELILTKWIKVSWERHPRRTVLRPSKELSRINPTSRVLLICRRRRAIRTAWRTKLTSSISRVRTWKWPRKANIRRSEPQVQDQTWVNPEFKPVVEMLQAIQITDRLLLSRQVETLATKPNPIINATTQSSTKGRARSTNSCKVLRNNSLTWWKTSK